MISSQTIKSHSLFDLQPGESWTVDDCTSCQCQGGRVTCSIRQCPAFQCASDEVPITTPGNCCPVCQKRKWLTHSNPVDGIFAVCLCVGLLSSIILYIACIQAFRPMVLTFQQNSSLGSILLHRQDYILYYYGSVVNSATAILGLLLWEETGLGLTLGEKNLFWRMISIN